jgi:subtilisin family serine protease
LSAIQRKPAWSWQFSADSLPSLTRVAPIDDISPEWAWAGSSGAGVRVAVIDSGIDADHPAIGGRVEGYVAITETDGELSYDESPHADSCGHGTACAGIIRSLAPECELYSVKVLGAAMTGRGSVFAAGLRWAIEHNMHVCNLSLGTTNRNLLVALHEIADVAYFRRIILVTAANNLPVPSYPSIFASVMSVAAHDVRDPNIFYYNPEPPVEFGALGIDVHVAWQNHDWITATGNSFAAPHITGFVTRLLGKHPDLAPFQVKAVMRALAANVSGARVPVLGNEVAGDG